MNVIVTEEAAYFPGIVHPESAAQGGGCPKTDRLLSEANQYALRFCRTMVVADLISLILKKKSTKLENFVVKFSSRVTIILCLSAVSLLLHQEISRPVSCTPYKSPISKDELDKRCASGYIFKTSRGQDHLKEDPHAKSPDFL